MVETKSESELSKQITMKSKFKNIKLLDQIDWLEEIELPLQNFVDNKEGVEEAMTDAVVASTLFQTHVFDKIKQDTELHVKSNFLRIAQYLYAKFIFLHRIVYEKYEKDNDIKKILYQTEPFEKNFLIKFKEEHGDLKRSPLPLKEVKVIEDIFVEQSNKRKEQEKIKHAGDTEEMKKMFLKEGIELKMEEKKHNSDRDEGFFIKDNINLKVYLMRSSTKERLKGVDRELNKIKQTWVRHKKVTTDVYNKIKQFEGIGEIYAMCGGGMQLQVFYGNKDGYLAILYLDMEDTRYNEEPKQKTWTLQVNGYKNDKLFQDFRVDNVKVRTSESVYGKTN